MTLPPLIGHEATVRRLLNAYERGRLAHALLFTGADGIGKQLAARVVASSFLCTSAASPPCGECEGCIQVAAGTHPDLISVDIPEGKKEIGVDLIRQAKRAVHMRAASGRCKVAIINEADRLSIAAQNALLKTLEEPPPQVFLILVTASPGMLLTTVRSRSQRVLFQPLSADQVIQVLTREGAVDEPEARALAGIADGSPGRALQLRDLWRNDEPTIITGLLASLHPARYVPVLRMSKALGRTEEDTGARLEFLLSAFREAAVRGVSEPFESASTGNGLLDNDPIAAVHAADAVAQTLRTLRRRNPNRSLLLEALGLRLARI